MNKPFSILLALSFLVSLFPTEPANADPVTCREGLTLHVGPLVRRLTCRAEWEPREAPPVSIAGRLFRPLARGAGTDPFDVDGIDFPVFPRRLVIVTNAHLVSESTMFQRYVNWRRAGGWDVLVGTEWAWDHPTDEDGDDRPARIRAWLKREYEERGPGYLLLIGNPVGSSNGVPMRQVDPLARILSRYPPWLAGYLSDVPTDHYYADVESNWDCDGDGVFGEFPDDAGEGCADWGPEFITGRIPYYSRIEDVDRILAATLAYEQAADKTYRDRVVFAGAFGGFRGQPSPAGDGSVYGADDDLAGFLYRTAADLPPLSRLTPVRLFEAEGVVVSNLEHEFPLNLSGLIEQWLLGASTVSWGGHGSSSTTHRQVWVADSNGDGLADASEVASPVFADSAMGGELGSAPLAVVHMMSCLNGHVETANNLGTALLGRGAVATASASRLAVGVGGEDWTPRPELAEATTNSYYFTRLVQAGHRVGDALAFTKWGLPGLSWSAYEQMPIQGGNAYSWLTKFEYNLYGDPTVSLERCSADADCRDDLPCNGTEKCQDGYCVHIDPVVCDQDESLPCMTTACDNATGQCEPVPRPDGIPCDNGLFCTVEDYCLGGFCVTGKQRSCPYYAPDCDEGQGICTYHRPEEEEQPDTGGCAAHPARRAPGLARLLFDLIG